MSNYINSNLLYRLSISTWTARKKDKDQSAKVNTEAGASEGAANVYKQLLPDSKELDDVQKCATSIRTWVYHNTSPWDDGGWRIGQCSRHMDFMREAGDKMREYDELVDKLVNVYAQAVQNAKFTLADMYNEDDYPGVNEVRAKYAINVDVKSLPNVEDFRVVDGIPQEEVDRLLASAKADVDERVSAAMESAYSRLFDVVSKMASTLTAYGEKDIKKFNDTLTGNISALIAVMPGLNITNDPKLAALADEAKRLLDYDLGDLRKDEGARKCAIEDATKLVKKFGRGHEVVEQPVVLATTSQAVASLNKLSAAMKRHGESAPKSPVLTDDDADLLSSMSGDD